MFKFLTIFLLFIACLYLDDVRDELRDMNATLLEIQNG